MMSLSRTQYGITAGKPPVLVLTILWVYSKHIANQSSLLPIRYSLSPLQPLHGPVVSGAVVYKVESVGRRRV